MERLCYSTSCFRLNCLSADLWAPQQSADVENFFHAKQKCLTTLWPCHVAVCVQLFLRMCAVSCLLAWAGRVAWTVHRMCYCLRGKSSSCLFQDRFLPSTHFPAALRQERISQALCFVSSLYFLVVPPQIFLIWKHNGQNMRGSDTWAGLDAVCFLVDCSHDVSVSF